jgi:iron complex outermembrane receptor protein
MARWNLPVGATNSLQVQTFYEHTDRDEVPVAETRDTFDADVQFAVGRWASHHLLWGGAYRTSSGRIDAVLPTQFFPPDLVDNVYSAFVQDEITVAPDRLRLSAGVKVEHNDYSGVETQPSVRLLWTPHADHGVFWSITRAVRTPSRVETDYQTTALVSPSPPTFVRLLPNPDFQPEELIAHEAGYRVRPAENAYFTVSGFYNQVDNILSTEGQPPFVEENPPPSHVVIPLTFGNGLRGHTYGVELTADVRATSWWRWTGNYSYLRIDLERKPGSNDLSQVRRNEGLSPRHQAQMQASIDLASQWTLDWMLRYVSRLAEGPVPAYATSNVRIGWQVDPQLEIALVGRNLHQAHHLEWSGSPNIDVQRSAHLQVTWGR